jgi:hydrogenase maturation protein HypF
MRLVGRRDKRRDATPLVIGAQARTASSGLLSRSDEGAMTEDGKARARVRLRGAVQGVGLRPFVHMLAGRHALTGFVFNDGDGVLIEIEGARSRLDDFLVALRAETPPLARFDAVVVEAMQPQGDVAFAIQDSRAGATRTRIPPDAAMCAACGGDLFDPRSRFHLYPFVTCTQCGPRFTLTHALPYDRAQTSMARFPMCDACADAYRDPANRRFHAEPIACPNCGPRLSHPISEIVCALKEGNIVAAKGVGGFHLLCDARDGAAVERLRERKRRGAKPFAAMVPNVASLSRYAAPTPQEIALAASPAAPIVLMQSRFLLPEAVAPRLSRLGVMLAYAPLHHLIFSAWEPARDRDAPSDIALIATSANPGGAPLIVDDAQARERLAGIADLIVGHDREIVVRVDDSVLTVTNGAPVFLRRARGFTPEPVELAQDGPSVLACGGHLKATVTVTRGREAFVSQHIGDLSDAETARAYHEAASHLLAFIGVKPDAVACDLHPDYVSSRYAEQTGLPVFAVQHHAAHVAAVAAEHRVASPILGAALDGHGMGDDGNAWGGELIALDGARWTRRGHVAPLMLIGGDHAARQPWRMGLSALLACGRLDEAERLFPDGDARRLASTLRSGVRFPGTTSLGRLFDAAAGLLGVRLTQDYEGQAACELEALVKTPRVLDAGWRVAAGALDLTPLLDHLVSSRLSARDGAELFHGTVAAALAEWIAAARPDGPVALGGGCMMNRILSELLVERLRANGVVALTARAVPANDGGLSLGQAAIARAILSEGTVSYARASR